MSDYETVTDFRSFVRWIASRRGKPGYGETMFRLSLLVVVSVCCLGFLAYVIYTSI